jgi:hypothetical protein
VVETAVPSATVSTGSVMDILAVPSVFQCRTVRYLMSNPITAIAPSVGVGYSEVHWFRAGGHSMVAMSARAKLALWCSGIAGRARYDVVDFKYSLAISIASTNVTGDPGCSLLYMRSRAIIHSQYLQAVCNRARHIGNPHK